MKKTALAFILAALLTTGLAHAAYAHGFEVFNDYFNADGTCSYYFEQGITVTMPEEWYQNTFIKTYGDKVTFFHKDSYEKWAEKGHENGGRLFTIGYSVNWDFKDLDEMTYIGYDEEEMLNYYAYKPTDCQGYGPDQEINAEYNELFHSVDEVIAGVKILSEGNADSDETAVIDRTPSSDLYKVAGTDLFSFECGTNWYVNEIGGGIIAKKSEDADIFENPELMIFPVNFEETIGEEVVKIKNAYMDTYQNRIAKEPEILSWEVTGTDRKPEGVKVLISSEDGMETITRIDLIEEMNGQYFEYSCAYVSSTHVEGAYEDETTYFEYMHVIETMECSI